MEVLVSIYVIPTLQWITEDKISSDPPNKNNDSVMKHIMTIKSEKSHYRCFQVSSYWILTFGEE